MPWFRKRVTVTSAADQIAEALAPRSVRRMKETNPLGTNEHERAIPPTTAQLRELSLLDVFALVRGMRSVYKGDSNDDRGFTFGLLVSWGSQLVDMGVFSDPEEFVKQSQVRFAAYEAALVRQSNFNPVESLALEVMSVCGVPRDPSIMVGVAGLFGGSAGGSKLFFEGFFRDYKVIPD